MHVSALLKCGLALTFFLASTTSTGLAGMLFPPAAPQVLQYPQKRPGHQKKKAATSQKQGRLEIPLWMTGALPPLPDVSPPPYRDPADEEAGRRFQQLLQEFLSSMQRSGKPYNYPFYREFEKNLQTRAREFAGKYGKNDPRSIQALEDFARAAISAGDRDAAKAALDDAIRLQEPRGPMSVAYARDLKQRCMLEALDSSLEQLPVCDHALDMRSHQPDATPLELATWLRALGLTSYRNRKRSLNYQEKSDSYYAKVPGISPAFLASEYRRLTILALAMQDTAAALRLNDMTNRYLAQGDANARKAMVTAAVVQGKKEITSAPNLLESVPPEKRAEVAQAQAWASRIANARSQAIASGRPQDATLAAILAAARMAKANETPPLIAQKTPGYNPLRANCSLVSEMVDLHADGGFDQMLTPDAKQTVEQQLTRLSPLGFWLVSSLESCSRFKETRVQSQGKGANTPQARAPDPNHVRGYGMMVRFKGAFTEVIAHRKHWLMPGYGEERNQAILALPETVTTLTKMLFTELPPEKQKEFSSLPPTARDKATKAYWNEWQKKHPGEVAEKRKELLRNPEYKTALGNLAQLKKAESDEAVLKGRPLAFLDMLQPGEAFLDIYEYRDLSDLSGAERYMAVISDRTGSSRKMELGPASVIDTVVRSFLDAINGGSDGMPEWKALQQKVVQPILSGLPAGTRKVWISPDSTLSFVPYASLLFDMGSPIEVAVIPSPYDFVRIRSSSLPRNERRLLLVGDLKYGPGTQFTDMEESKKELDVLSKEARDNRLSVEILSGSQVTRSAVTRHLRNVRYLHFSTHGEVDDPASRSKAFLKGRLALSMANSATNGSMMTADDVRQLDLSSAEMVTLSACDTGKGRAIEGQGMLGFQTAFMAAGARSLLFSLWKAPLATDDNGADATSIFMDSFYEGLWKKKLAKADALRQAQMAVRSNPRFANPRFWATWVLVGEAW